MRRRCDRTPLGLACTKARGGGNAGTHLCPMGASHLSGTCTGPALAPFVPIRSPFVRGRLFAEFGLFCRDVKAPPSFYKVGIMVAVQRHWRGVAPLEARIQHRGAWFSGRDVSDLYESKVLHPTLLGCGRGRKKGLGRGALGPKCQGASTRERRDGRSTAKTARAPLSPSSEPREPESPSRQLGVSTC